MQRKNFHKFVFNISSKLTNLFPQAGARFLNNSVANLFGNNLVTAYYKNKAFRRLHKIQEFNRILVVADLNIGDAINLQASITALREFFPEIQIDYIVNRNARYLLEGNPAISTLMPVLSGMPYPDENDFHIIRSILSMIPYDMIFNFCPQFNEKHFHPNQDKVISYHALAATIIRDENDESSINHVIFQAHKFIDSLFLPFINPIYNQHFNGVNVYLSDEAIEEAQLFFMYHNFFNQNQSILFNPDTSSVYSRIPLSYQINLIKRLAKLPQVGAILLAAGHMEKNIEQKILRAISYRERGKITVVPATMPLDAYAALIDLADVYITGDTGPLHIAAARKIRASDQTPLRNQTALYSIFGATPARIYGYDSARSGFFPPNQDAPAHTYIADSHCRNITCINKSEKKCKTVRCFQELDMPGIVKDIESYLKKNYCRYSMLPDMKKIEIIGTKDLNAVSP